MNNQQTIPPLKIGLDVCLNDQPTKPSNAVVFPERHVSHHVLDCMCLNREGPTLYMGGGRSGKLLQVHFKMCV